MKWYEENQTSSSTASIAYECPLFVGLTQSCSLDPWALDFAATNNIPGNKSFISSLSTSDFLPFVTMANGSRALSHS